jgi:hypothetical protein
MLRLRHPSPKHAVLSPAEETQVIVIIWVMTRNNLLTKFAGRKLRSLTKEERLSLWKHVIKRSHEVENYILVMSDVKKPISHNAILTDGGSRGSM